MPLPPLVPLPSLPNFSARAVAPMYMYMYTRTRRELILQKSNDPAGPGPARHPRLLRLGLVGY